MPKLDSSAVSVSSCVQETPCSLSSQSVFSQTSAVDVRGGGTTKSRSVELVSQTNSDVMDQLEEVMEEVMEEEEEESAAGGGASGMALALSQSQLMSPEPMEDESEEQGADSIIVVTDSEKHSQILKKDVTNSSQPIRANVAASTNGHESQSRAKKVNAAPDRLSQTERAGPEPEALKDKSLSDSSGGKVDADVLYLTVLSSPCGSQHGGREPYKKFPERK
nr:PREDICTED: uncharacterized protein LOC109623692 [Paralichthys olivaceus]